MTQYIERACEHDTTKHFVGIDKRFTRTDVCLKKQLRTARIGTVPEVCRRHRPRFAQPAIAYNVFLPPIPFLSPLPFLSAFFSHPPAVRFIFTRPCLSYLIFYFKIYLRNKKVHRAGDVCPSVSDVSD